ncbi:MAG: EVE domain-containing protein [Deltaproteobacteria bacterium]|nr:EVE domain-containing protein [Deltaproteobacteria bacterium]
MREKDIENLIAEYPDEFFPNSGFRLIGQQVKLGKCYADIIFEDRYKRKVIVEVKRGILSRDASGQVMEYYGLLKTESPDDFVEMILCANIIPPERKKYLETIGIECKELGINLVNQIAQKVNYHFVDEQHRQEKEQEQELTTSEKIWIFQANPQRYDILNALADDEIGNFMHWEVNQHRSEITKGHIGIIWLSGKEAGIYAITEILINPQIMGEPEVEKRYWVDDADKVGERLRVKMKIVKNLLHSPLLKETIRANGLHNLSILKQPRGTNFPVTSDEWLKIRALIEK